MYFENATSGIYSDLYYANLCSNSNNCKIVKGLQEI